MVDLSRPKGRIRRQNELLGFRDKPEGEILVQAIAAQMCLYYHGDMSGFCEYLLHKGRITESQLARAKSQTNNMNLDVGRCAYAFGFIDEPHIRDIMALQQRTGQTFGVNTLALGYLTQGQIKTILRIQEKYRVTIEEVLVADGALTPEELDEERKIFQATSSR